MDGGGGGRRKGGHTAIIISIWKTHRGSAYKLISKIVVDTSNQKLFYSEKQTVRPIFDSFIVSNAGSLSHKYIIYYEGSIVIMKKNSFKILEELSDSGSHELKKVFFFKIEKTKIECFIVAK